MKKTIVSMLFAVCALQFTACGNGGKLNTEESATVEAEDILDSGSEKPLEGSSGAEHGASTEDLNSGERYEAYRKALLQLIDDRIFPDGTEADYEEGSHFAVQDIDGDGRDELLISYAANTMAGMKLGIYDYEENSGELYEEFGEFPFAVFYDNNIVTADASHNHGKSFMDDFWPYSLYQYDAAADRYQLIAGVDAWQKEYIEEGFPAETDGDGNGIVYCLSDGAGEESYLDDADYQAWRSEYLEGAEILQIDWKAFEKSNIDVAL